MDRVFNAIHRRILRLPHALATLHVAFSLPAAGADGAGWRSNLYPEDWQRPDATASFASDKLIQDFSFAGYRRGEEDIPDLAGPVFDATTYGADPSGASDSTLAIQEAINAAAAAGGGVVFLPAGEFRVSPQGTNNHCLRIFTSGVVLRGAGTAETFLLNTSYEMRGKAVVQISSASISTGTARNITSDLTGPTRRIPVESAGSFAPGDFVRIEWTFTEEWIAEHNQQPWWSESSRPANARYHREVLATNPAEGWIEVDAPTRYTIRTRDNARVIPQIGLLTGVGVESLSIGNLQHPGTVWGSGDYTNPNRPAYDVHASWLIRMSHVFDGWITGVHSRQAAANTSTCHMLSNGVSLVNCLRITVRDCEMRRPQYGGGGGNGYMYRVQHSNECLLENCIADFSRHGFVISHAGTSGNVFLLCDDRNTERATGSTGSYNTGGSGSDNHMHFSHSNLWDRCHAHNSFYTAHHRGNSGTTPHGLTSAHAVYWNTTGSGTRYPVIVRSGQARYGYVIGTSGSASSASNPTGGNTAPADHLEGIGLGATLDPPSLYLDQLARRLVPKLTLSGQPASFPNNTFTVEAALTLDGEPVDAPHTLVWDVVSAPPEARHTSTSAGASGRAFTVSRPGTYTIGATGLLGGEAFSGTVAIEVSPPFAANEIIDLLPQADSHAQGPPSDSLNFGGATELLVKSVGAPHVHREAYTRFDLGGTRAEPILDATLHLYFTRTNPEATGRTTVVADPDTWGEMTLNWNNRPTVQTGVVGEWNSLNQDWLALDVWHVMPATLGGDGSTITFRHQILNQPSTPVYAFASREHPDPSLAPILRIRLALPTLDDWLAENGGLDPHERGPLDDPDGDGLPNLLEAWLGTNPSQSDIGALPRMTAHSGDIEFHLQLNANPPGGLFYFLEYSDTLAPDDWHPAPGAAWEPTGPAAHGRIPTVVRFSDDPSAMRRFYRINVQVP